MTQNTLYIAEPLFSKKLQEFSADASCPPFKKIGITTDSPTRREKELMGTVSPVKLSIVKAWTNIDARKVESMLHSILNNSRLDGEYFWDGNETLVDAVSNFIEQYHTEANVIPMEDDQDVQDAARAVDNHRIQRINAEVIPRLEKMNLKFSKLKGADKQKGERVRINLKDYFCILAPRSGSRYSLTIFSKSRTEEDAINDFPGAVELMATSTEESHRKARIPMTDLDAIFEAMKMYLKSQS